MTVSTDPAPAEREQRSRRIPDFFIVGHAKCGTTALYDMLKPHPEIFLPEVKEPYYFAADKPQPRRRFGRRWRTLDQTGTHAETFDEYLSLFKEAGPGQRVGEASTHYLWSAVAPARIAEVQPQAQIIGILREPAAFLRSLHLQLCQNGNETQLNFRRAMELEDARRVGKRIPRRSEWPRYILYSDRVRYVEQLRRYHETFGPERVLALIYDDYRDDNEGTVRTILRFLGVDDSVAVRSTTVNPSVSVRSVHLQSRVRGVARAERPAGRALKRAIGAVTSQRFRHAVVYPLRKRVVVGAPPPVDESFMLELRRRFKPEVEALSEYLDRDLVALWGYDRIG
jgi:hypothetical protein